MKSEFDHVLSFNSNNMPVQEKGGLAVCSATGNEINRKKERKKRIIITEILDTRQNSKINHSEYWPQLTTVVFHWTAKNSFYILYVVIIDWT